MSSVLKALEEENQENVRNILTSNRSESEQRVKLDEYQKKYSKRLEFVLQGGYMNGFRNKRDIQGN